MYARERCSSGKRLRGNGKAHSRAGTAIWEPCLQLEGPGTGRVFSRNPIHTFIAGAGAGHAAFSPTRHARVSTVSSFSYTMQLPLMNNGPKKGRTPCAQPTAGLDGPAQRSPERRVRSAPDARDNSAANFWATRQKPQCFHSSVRAPRMIATAFGRTFSWPKDVLNIGTTVRESTKQMDDSTHCLILSAPVGRPRKIFRLPPRALAGASRRATARVLLVP